MYTFRAEKVRKLRMNHELTVYAFGKRVGNKPNYMVVGWEEGRITPSIPTLEKMCVEFGVEPNYFFTK